MKKKTNKKVTKTPKKVNKPKAKKAATKTNKTKKSTSKATKKVTKKPVKKVTKKATAKKSTSKVKKKVKKSIFNDKKVQKKIDKWANITISESGEIIDKTGKLDAEIEKDRKIKEKKVSKGVIQKSLEAQTSKKSAKEGVTFGEAGDGIYDDNGDWNGSTRTDAQIAAIKNPRLKDLAERIDKQQEEVRRAREDEDDPDYIANCVIELKRLRAQYEEIEREEG